VVTGTVEQRFPGLTLLSRLVPNRRSADGHGVRSRTGGHAAFADLLQELVRADDRAGTFRDRLISGDSRLVEQAAGTSVGGQQGFDLRSQGRVLTAGSVQEGRPLRGGANLQGLGKDRFFRQRGLGHGFSSSTRTLCPRSDP
jgi:hypothetical protein